MSAKEKQRWIADETFAQQETEQQVYNDYYADIPDFKYCSQSW